MDEDNNLIERRKKYGIELTAILTTIPTTIDYALCLCSYAECLYNIKTVYIISRFSLTLSGIGGLELKYLPNGKSAVEGKTAQKWLYLKNNDDDERDVE